jgi:hypothetical protein
MIKPIEQINFFSFCRHPHLNALQLIVSIKPVFFIPPHNLQSIFIVFIQPFYDLQIESAKVTQLCISSFLLLFD